MSDGDKVTASTMVMVQYSIYHRCSNLGPQRTLGSFNKLSKSYRLMQKDEVMGEDDAGMME